MLGSLLALALAAAPSTRQIAIYPLRHPAGREAQAVALGELLATTLRARGLEPSVQSAPDAYSGCETEPCLAPRSGASPGGAIVATWTAFGQGAVLSSVVLDGRAGQGTFELAVPATSEAELPAATAALGNAIADQLEAAPRVSEKEERPTFGLALKVGNTFGSVAENAPQLSGLSLRFDVEIDYLAAPQFWPFLDLSLVLAKDASGQRVQLVPVLVGAKYVFRHDRTLRPFTGMALGLDFLSEPLEPDTGGSSSFAVYGVGGLDWMVLPNLAVVAEASLDLNGLEASGGSGVLFAIGLNLGARVLF